MGKQGNIEYREIGKRVKLPKHTLNLRHTHIHVQKNLRVKLEIELKERMCA